MNKVLPLLVILFITEFNIVNAQKSKFEAYMGAEFDLHTYNQLKNKTNCSTGKLSIVNFIIATGVFVLLNLQNLNAQSFNYSLCLSVLKYEKNGVRTFTPEFNNTEKGFQVGPLVSYHPGNTLFRVYSGLIYSKYYSRLYDLDIIKIPTGAKIVMGKKFGGTVGGGLNFNYLVKIPSYFSQDQNLNRNMFSYSLSAGFFIKTNPFIYNIEIQAEPYLTHFTKSSFELFFSVIALNLIITY